MNKEEFMESMSTWPLEVQDQIPLDKASIQCFINPESYSLSYPPIDWSNVEWKKQEIVFNSPWMVDNLYSSFVDMVDQMIDSFFENRNMLGGEDIERHKRIAEYLFYNGTWPKSPLLAITKENKMIVVDGGHRMAQMLIYRSVLYKVFDPQVQPFVFLQEKHKIWIGKEPK